MLHVATSKRLTNIIVAYLHQNFDDLYINLLKNDLQRVEFNKYLSYDRKSSLKS